MRWVFVLLLALVATASGGEARAEKRVALVIGNAAYQNTAALNNPSNDAADLSAALQRLDFEVIEGRDLDKRAMERLVRQFGIKLAGADVALFFYAGHGLQVGGQNYLVPIDAKLASEGDVDFESLPVSLVARQMEREAKTSLILLDACRDNPLSRNLARAMSTRSSQVGQGLAEVKTGVGTLIAFSTQPGYVALDGVGRNSPYAEALLKYIEAPGQDVSGVLVEVRNDVLKATGGKQVPWEHTSLTGQVYLKAGPASGSAAAGELAKLPAARGPDPELEIAFWNSVKDSKSPAVIEAYLERYPNGTFAGLAKVMVAQLKGAPVKAPEQATRVALPEVKPPDPRVLARSLQTELKRVGCDPGEIDGQWGDKGREALDQFGRHAKMSMPSQEPTAAALDAVTARKERVCPLECGKGTAEVEGKCVATESKTKKSKSASSSRSRERSSSSSEGSSSSGGGIIGGGGISIGIGGGRGRVGIGF